MTEFIKVSVVHYRDDITGSESVVAEFVVVPRFGETVHISVIAHDGTERQGGEITRRTIVGDVFRVMHCSRGMSLTEEEMTTVFLNVTEVY